MTQTILFMCPHGAAKSVLAAAYFNRSADQRGLPYHAEFAGTDPDDMISPTVLAMLQDGGFDAPAHNPRHVTGRDLAESALIVSIGCNLDGIAPPDAQVRDWSDVPPVSVDAAVALRAIHQRVDDLIDELK
jgi:arsenate reductase (thioredoxin)